MLTCTEIFGIVPTVVGAGFGGGAGRLVVKVNVCVIDCEAVSVAVIVIVDVPAVLPGVIVKTDPDIDTATTPVFDDTAEYSSASVSLKYDAMFNVAADPPVSAVRLEIVPTRVGAGFVGGAAVISATKRCCAVWLAVSVAVTVMVAMPAALPGVTVTTLPDTDTAALLAFEDTAEYVSVSVSRKYDATLTRCAAELTCAEIDGIVPTVVGAGFVVTGRAVVTVNVPRSWTCPAPQATSVIVAVPTVLPGVSVSVPPEIDA